MADFLRLALRGARIDRSRNEAALRLFAKGDERAAAAASARAEDEAEDARLAESDSDNSGGEKEEEDDEDDTAEEALAVFAVGARGAADAGGRAERPARAVSAASEAEAAAKTRATSGRSARKAVKEFRRRYGIHLSGTDVPDPCEGYDALRRCGVPAYIINNMTGAPPDGCGYQKLTPVQMAAMPAVLAGRDCVIHAPTGAGKTAAFAVPVLALLRRPCDHGVRALLLAPTRELAAQLARHVRALGRAPEGGWSVSRASVGSSSSSASSSSDEQDWRVTLLNKTNMHPDAWAAGSRAALRHDILVATPRRVCALLGNSSGDGGGSEAPAAAAAAGPVQKRGQQKKTTQKKKGMTDAPARTGISLVALRIVVLDEADRLFSSGFLVQIMRIFAAAGEQAAAAAAAVRATGIAARKKGARKKARLPLEAAPRLQRILCSATTLGGVDELVRSALTDPVRVAVGRRGAAASTIDQRLVYCGDEGGKLFALRRLVTEGELRPPMLIFVQSKRRAEQLFEEVRWDLHAAPASEAGGGGAAGGGGDESRVGLLHAEMPQREREAAVRRLRVGSTLALVCTDLLARGVDFRGVNSVVNFDIPQTANAYIHRIGRTGRAGRRGTAVTFFTDGDRGLLREVAGVIARSAPDAARAGAGVASWMMDLPTLSKGKKRALAESAPQRKRISVKKKATTPQEEQRKRRRRHGGHAGGTRK